MALTREQYVIQSVEDYLRRQLFDVRGFPEDKIEVKDSFTGENRETPLEKNWVAAGFNFDDGGRQAEVGSTLVRRIYTIEFFVFGLDATWAENLASGLRESLENDLMIPLVDIGEAGRPETGEALEVLNVQAQREPVPNPQPWQRFTWTVRLRVEDTYDARLA
jgi:hypothetical protein